MVKNVWNLRPVDHDTLKKAKHALLCMQRHSWEHGVTMQAFLEAGDMDTVILLAKEAAYRMSEDGRPALIDYYHAVTDPVSVGEALLSAWHTTGDGDLGKCLEKMKKWVMEDAPRNAEGILYHLDDSRQFWADSMYMLPPAMASLGYPGEGHAQMEGYWKALYDDADGLVHHIWDEDQQKYTRTAYWGVGNGWALAGIARLIDLLPDEMAAEKRDWVNKEKKLLLSVLKFRCEEGFHDILDAEESFIEINLAQMVSYTIYRGIRSGWLPRGEWLKTAEELRMLSEKNLDRYGIIRNACGAPDFNKPGTAPEAQAFYILMETAAENVRYRN